LSMALHFRRRILQFCGMHEQARESIDEEYRLCHQHGFAFWEAHAILARGGLLISEGNLDEAQSQIESTWQWLQAAGLKCSLDFPCTLLAKAFLRAGYAEEAQRWVERGFELAEAGDDCCFQSELLRLQGEILLARKPALDAEAAAQFEQAI